MNLQIFPTTELKGRIELPASKSYSIRAFIIAALGGTSQILNPSDCSDAIVAKSAASALGAKVEKTKKGVYFLRPKRRAKALKSINVQESGTVLRFVLPLVALKSDRAKITGEGTLKGRPNAFLTKALRGMGADIRGRGTKESIPIIYKGGNLKGGKIVIDGSLSSQFISSLLISAPLLHEDTQLTLKGKTIVSGDYVTMTRKVQALSGVKVQKKSEKRYVIRADQTYKGLKRFVVPSDYGLAAFHLAAAALVPSQVSLVGHFPGNLEQADGAIIAFLRQMGVRFRHTIKGFTVRGPYTLKGGTFSLKDAPDLVPIMAVLCLFADSQSRLKDIAHVRSKESDRISDLRRELIKVGADIKEKPNELIIKPRPSYKANCLLNPHRDHRLAMAFSVLGLKVGARVTDINCCAKSYPRFVRDFRKLGARTKPF